MYFVSILANNIQPISKFYYEKLFHESNFEEKNIYILPCIVTVDTKLRIFQYKSNNNVLYLNKMFFKCGKISSPVCLLCKMNDETLARLFFESVRTNHLFKKRQSICSNALISSPLTPQSLSYRDCLIYLKIAFY